MSRLFDYNSGLAAVFVQIEQRIKSDIHAEGESYVRDADAEQWAEHLAGKYKLNPPRIIEEHIQIEDLGERQVNATDMPGVTYSLIEWGNVIRPGRGVRLVVPVQGNVELLRNAPSGGAPVVEGAVVEGGKVCRQWDWPLARGTEALNREINQVIGAVKDGAAKVAAEVEMRNDALAPSRGRSLPTDAPSWPPTATSSLA